MRRSDICLLFVLVRIDNWIPIHRAHSSTVLHALTYERWSNGLVTSSTIVAVATDIVVCECVRIRLTLQNKTKLFKSSWKCTFRCRISKHQTHNSSTYSIPLKLPKCGLFWSDGLKIWRELEIQKPSWNATWVRFKEWNRQQQMSLPMVVNNMSNCFAWYHLNGSSIGHILLDDV